MIVTQIFLQVRKAAMLAGLALVSVSATDIDAAAPMTKIANPGFYSFMLGDFEVTAISDGTFSLDADKLLTNITPEKIKSTLAKQHMTSPVEGSVNGYLINTGSKLILVDTGAGTFFGPTLNHFVDNLRAAGYQPEQVDEIYITHMHGDHIGGLITTDGKIAFPNAVLRANKADSDFWLSQENMDKAPEAMKGFFKAPMASVGLYVTAGKYKPFEGDVELVPGIKAVASKGHTPGHTTYVVTSKGMKLDLIGDLIHVGAIQFGDPTVTIMFDSDSVAAEAERQKEFAQAAKQGTLIGAAHISFPGLGYLHAKGKGYEWQPVNYTSMR